MFSALAEKLVKKAETNAIIKRYKTVTVWLKKNSFLLRLKIQVEKTIRIPQIAYKKSK